jgi:hypothetical protein
MVISGAPVKSAPGAPLPKCHARPRNDADALMAIAAAGEIMEWNRRVDAGGRTRACLTKSQRVRRTFGNG